MEIIFFLVCFFASIIGAVCGIGGGVIIKPVLDTFGILSVSAINFLSGCTVLAMTSYSVLKNKISGVSQIAFETSFPLAVGAAIGGVAGKQLFSLILEQSGEQKVIGAIQAGCLLSVTAGTLLYTILKEKIKAKSIRNPMFCFLLGALLGTLSAFLGIGGGPINLVVLYYFFSMSTKVAVENSLYIILFSQITSLLCTFFSGKVPKVSAGLVLLMAVGGVLGGIVGRAWNKKLSECKVDQLFILLMIVLIFINGYNVVQFCVQPGG